MEKIIALDPGGTTGWASWSDVPGNPWLFGQLGPEDHHLGLYNLLEGSRFEASLTVVCESFEFRQNRQRDNINLMSREYIGVVNLFNHATNTPVVFQTAGRAKPFVTDEKLKAMDLWIPGQKHARDAFRHLITYMVQKRNRHDLIESWKDL